MGSAALRIDPWVKETFTAEPLTSSQPPMQEVCQPIQATFVPISVPTPPVSAAVSLLPQIPTSLPATSISASTSFQPYISTPLPAPAVSTTTHLLAPDVSLNDDDFQDIPVPHRLSVEELYKIKSHANSFKIFASQLTRRLLPEPFGPDNLRFKYSYNGFRNEKAELDRERKCYLQRYIIYFHPEMRNTNVYQKTVINAVNECLRRP